MRRTFGALFVAVLAVAAPASAQPPNIVLVVADDLGYGDLGSYGQTRIATPALDRLAREGTRLTAAYASAPVCAPSRCSILTGLHAGHCAVHANAEPNTPLSPDDPTIAEVLGAAGYRTGIVGKWALGGELRDGSPFAVWSAPWNVGFDAALVTLDQELAQDHSPPWLWHAQGGVGVRELLEANAGDAHGVFDDDRFVEGALAFVDDAVAEHRPFFLYVALTLPHRELTPPSLGAYASEPWPAAERAYAAMVGRIDDDVARLVEHLRAAGVLDHTIVLFTSDNGPTSIDGHEASFFDSSGGLRGQKRDLYEGGTRVPLVVWGAGIAEGATIDTPVALIDLLPTLAALAEAPAPTAIDGASIAEGLRSGVLASPHAAIYTSVDRGVGSEVGTRRALRAGDRKLVERADGTVELYDLVADPHETTDLSGDHRTEVDALRARIAAESRPRPEAVDPTLRLVGEGLEDVLPGRARRFVPVLHLVLDGAHEGEARVESELASPPLVATRHDGPTPHLTVPADRALSFGDEPFTLEAWVRLDPASGAREWIVSSKQTGRDDAFLDLGVLARAGDLAHGERMIGSGPERTGHELAVVFGDPRLGHHEPWGVVSTLAIDDAELHRVTVRFDARRDRVRFSIDERTETFEILDRGHVVGDAPLVIGAHLDPQGGIDGGLHGALLELRLSRGLVPIGDRLSRGAAQVTGDTVTLDLGVLAVGSAAIDRSYRLESAGDRRVRAMDVTLDTEGMDDDRVSLTGPARATLFSRSDHVTLQLHLDPTRAGAIDETFVVRGTVRRRGWPAVRSPLRVRVRARIEASTAAPSAWPGVLVIAALLLGPLAVLFALRRPSRRSVPVIEQA